MKVAGVRVAGVSCLLSTTLAHSCTEAPYSLIVFDFGELRSRHAVVWGLREVEFWRLAAHGMQQFNRLGQSPIRLLFGCFVPRIVFSGSSRVLADSKHLQTLKHCRAKLELGEVRVNSGRGILHASMSLLSFHASLSSAAFCSTARPRPHPA